MKCAEWFFHKVDKSTDDTENISRIVIVELGNTKTFLFED